MLDRGAQGVPSPAQRRRPVQKSQLFWALAFTALLLVAIPGAAWLYGGGDLPFSEAPIEALAGADAAPELAYASGRWPKDADGDKLDDRIPYFDGVKSVLVSFRRAIDTADENRLYEIPGLAIIYRFQLVNGAWMSLPLDQVHQLAALDFVEYIELDTVWEQQLDVSARAVTARDSRNAIMPDGHNVVAYRGSWRGDPGSSRYYEGEAGRGVLVAVMDGGLDDSHPALRDRNGDSATNDTKVIVRMSAWPFAVCSAIARPPAFPPRSCPVVSPFSPQTGNAASEPRVLTLPHATTVAAIVAGTGDTFGADGIMAANNPNFIDRWAYAGVAPRADLADVNVFIGFDHDCRTIPTDPPQAVCTGTIDALEDQGLGGPPGTTNGVSVDALRNAAAQIDNDGGAPVSGSIAVGADVIAAYNAQFDPPIQVVVLPLIDRDNCGANTGITTFTDLVISALAAQGVSVVASAGQNHRDAQGRPHLCSPATVPNIITVGAYDDNGTITRADDALWPSSDRPSRTQLDVGVVKPDLYAPGVNIFGPRNRIQGGGSAEYWEMTGTSAAAAHAAGAAAVVLSANQTQPCPQVEGPCARIGPFDIKTILASRAYGRNATAPYVDKTGGGATENQPNGVRDTNATIGWNITRGYGFLDLQSSLCGLVNYTCPQPWEYMNGTRILIPNPSAAARPGQSAIFRGTIRTVDPLSEFFWKNRTAGEMFRFGDRIGDVQVNFTLGACDANACDLRAAPNRTALANPDGTFELSFQIPTEQPFGRAPCYLWTATKGATEIRDAIGGSPGVPCWLTTEGTSQFGCGNPPLANCLVAQTSRQHTFQNNPEVDLVRGILQLTDDRGEVRFTANQKIVARWDGAPLGHRVKEYTTSNETGLKDGALATIEFPVDGIDGCYPLTLEFQAPVGSPIQGTAKTVMVCVSLATRIQNFEVVGVQPGTTFVNDGSPLDVVVRGQLLTSANLPVANGAIKLSSVSRGSTRVLTALTTNDQGWFSTSLDLRQFLSGSFNLFVDYEGKTASGVAGEGSFVLVPTSSERFPFSVVLKPQIALPKRPVVYRGETAVINGTLLNPVGRGIGAQTVEIRWEGQTTFTESARTDRQGRFRLEHKVSKAETLGNVTLWVTYPGGPDLSPNFAVTQIEVRGRSVLELHEGQAERGQDALIEGFLYDDTSRPLTGQRVAILWGTEPIGNATTNTLGHYSLARPIPRDERVGPVTIRADFHGLSYIDGSVKQERFGILAPTGLVIEQVEKRVQGGVEIATRILDDQGHPISDQRVLDFYLANARPAQREFVTYLSKLDLSNALSPEARIRHGYQFNDAFGISDGARLSVSIDQGRTWQPVVPRDGYDVPDVTSLEGGPGWSGSTSGWFPVKFNLTELNRADEVRFRLRMKTSPLSNQIQIGVDTLRVRDGNRTLFADDFETFGAKGYGDYWSLPGGQGGSFVVGREAVTGATRGVLGTNLEGTYPPSMNAIAISPRMTLPESRYNFVLMRYQLDIGNAGDYASVLMEDPITGKATILSPYQEPSFGTLPPTNGQWRWMLYQLPSILGGKQIRLQLTFVSDGQLQGDGFQVDEFRVLTGAEKLDTTIVAHPDPARWTLSNFEQGPLRDVDAYIATEDTAITYPVVTDAQTTSLKNVNLVHMATPFPIRSFGETHNTLTVYPEGLLAIGDVQQEPTRLCKDDPSKCDLAALNFGVPLVAPAWDVDLRSTNATLYTTTEGEAPDRDFVVEWRGLEAPGSQTRTSRFQVRLHEQGDIAFHYGSMAFDDPRCTLPLNDPLRSRCTDFGAHSLVGIAGPNGASVLPLHTREAALGDNVRIYLSQLVADFDQGCVGNKDEPCNDIPALVPDIYDPGEPTSGAYRSRTPADAILREGFDLSKAGEAYLVTRQFVEMGRFDQFQVQARAGETGLWRPLVALQGGYTEALGTFYADRSGRWQTGVYDLAPFVGQRTQIRFLVSPDSQGVGQDIGVAVREVFAITAPRQFGPSSSDTFESYLDTTRGGKTWWSSRILGDTETNPPWTWSAHPPGVPEELGKRFVRLGDGTNSELADTTFLLTSPPLKLAGSRYPILEYWQLGILPDALDGLVLEASTDGGITYRPIKPEGGGYVDYLDTINGPGWSGPQFGLETHRFDLTPYASNDVRLRLEYGAGATPFASRWILEDFVIEDTRKDDPATGKPVVYLKEDGRFSADKWSVSPGVWKPHDVASALETGRDDLNAIAQLTASGGRLVHRIPLPKGTPRGPLTATVLFPGVESTYGGAVWSSELIVEQETNVVGVTLRNLHDQKDYIIRNRTFTVEGIVQDRDGAPIRDGLLQIELDGVVVGSARTLETGVFTTQPIFLPVTWATGPHSLTVKYTGDPKQYVLESKAEKRVTVKGLTSVLIERQVAKEDDFQVTLRAIDDLGTPLVRTAIDIHVGEAEIHELTTDAAGRATFTTSVAVDENTLVAYKVESLGTDVFLGRQLDTEVTVPAAAKNPIPWWVWVIVAAVVLVGGFLLYVLIAKRRRRLHLVEELARRIELVEYAIATGDPVRLAIFDLYRAFLHTLDRAGMARPASETPAEVERALRANLPDSMHAAVGSISDLFQEARYSEHALSESERGRVQESLHAIRAALERAAPAPAAGSVPA